MRTKTAATWSLHTAGGLLLLFGCGSPAGPVDENKDPCDVAREIRPSSDFLTVPQEADIVARISPGGFGSLFQDFGNTNRLVIHLQQMVKSDSAVTVIRRLLTCGGAYPGWSNQLVDVSNPLFQAGQYTASQLLAYRSTLQPLQNDPAVWAIEIDPETNKVWIGLRSGTESSRIGQAVTTQGVPMEAVEIEAPPLVSGSEPFQVLDSVIVPTPHSTDNGVFLAEARVTYTNRFSETRYPDNCTTIDGSRVSFLYRIERWDGQTWRNIYDPICRSVALLPRPIEPGQSRTDTIPFVGVRRLRSVPLWRTARITGYYRFVGTVFLSTTPNPPFLANPAPEAQNSTPFRIRNSLPF